MENEEKPEPKFAQLLASTSSFSIGSQNFCLPALVRLGKGFFTTEVTENCIKINSHVSAGYLVLNLLCDLCVSVVNPIPKL